MYASVYLFAFVVYVHKLSSVTCLLGQGGAMSGYLGDFVALGGRTACMRSEES